MEKIKEEKTENFGDHITLQFDAVITSNNHLDVIKRIIYCVKNNDETHIGMTLKNEWVFYKILDILSLFDVNIEIKHEKIYKVGMHTGVCKVISTVKPNN